MQAHTIDGGVHFHQVRRSTIVPRLLMAAPRRFAGRIPELAALTSTLGNAISPTRDSGIVVVSGPGGIGKTALALYWAHENVHNYPDGQLYVNLQGFGPSESPMMADVALYGFLAALGIDFAMIPSELNARSALYRSSVANKNMIVILDNARDADQVVPLLPGSPTCGVVVTSRNRLPGLINVYGGRPLPLDVLQQEEAYAVLATRLGSNRLDTEPEAAAELLRYCAGFPLALSVVAGQAEAHPTFSLATLASELNDSASRLSGMDNDDLISDFSAVLSWSYRALSPLPAKVFRLLSLMTGEDITSSAVASLAALPWQEAKAALRTLEQMSLLHQHLPDRYRMHDLIRLYATRVAHDTDSQGHLETALRRLVDFYLHTAYSAERCLYKYPPIDLEEPVAGSRPVLLTDEMAAWTWLTAEHACLLAAQKAAFDQNWCAAVWQFAWTLETYQRWRGLAQDRVACWRTALAAANQLTDLTIQSLVLRFLGWSSSYLAHYTTGVKYLEQALVLSEKSGDEFGHAHAHFVLGVVCTEAGDEQMALSHTVRALDAFRLLNEPIWVAMSLNNIGWSYAKLESYEQARGSLLDALDVLRGHPDRNAEAAVLDSMGYVAYQTREYGQALVFYQRSLTLARKLHHTYDEATSLEHLAEAHDALGEWHLARFAWRQAWHLYRVQRRHSDADRVSLRLNPDENRDTHT